MRKRQQNTRACPQPKWRVWGAIGVVWVLLGVTPCGCSAERKPVAAARDDAVDRVRDTDWPTWRHDVYRSGVTRERIRPPLRLAWTHATKRPPAPAWTESPARHDYLHEWYDLKPRQQFDRCFDVAVVDDRVYYGSSVDGSVTALRIDTGDVVWRVFTGGPVRFAPHVADGRVYVGSDDGYVYCLRAEDGTVVWKERAGPANDMIWGNQKMISVWPVRTGVTVAGGDVFWTAGIFPEEGMFLCKRNRLDGAGGWVKPATAPPQGYLVALRDRIIIPCGKSYPRVYARETGACVGELNRSSRDGGCWVIVSNDRDEVWTGPTTDNATQGFETDSAAYVASVKDANSLLVDGAHAYYTTNSAVVKHERATHTEVWRRTCAFAHVLIKAGDLLFAGGDGEVAALDLGGAVVWTAPAEGGVYGLAAARGRLFASTDAGKIHCFEAPAAEN